MLRRISVLLLGSSLVLSVGPKAWAADDPRFAAEFVQGLREKGYFDVALQFLEQLRQDPDTPKDLKRTLEYEEGRTLIVEATQSSDPDVSKGKLDQAKVKIEAFVKANPELPQTTAALVELALLLYERGMNEVDLSGDARAANDREARLAGARGYYESARSAYARAFERLNAKLAEYPKFIPPDDPRKLERENLRNTVMQAELQKSIVDYYEAQTYSAGSKERSEWLDKALVSFEDIFKRFRTQRAGLTARMWQGKCYEEQGKLGEATGIYKELLDHPDPGLRPLQKQVDYFRIIVMGKRKEHALAADECVNWLKMFPKERRTYESLGVQFELAKDLLAQVPDLTGADRDKATKMATDYLTDVVRVVSPFKPEALTLLQKYRPNAALIAADVAKLTPDEAIAQASQAISTMAYANAITLLKVAIRKAEPARDPAKANSARFLLGYAEMMLKRYYEAAVVYEHVARKYPRDEWAAKSADFGMQALLEAYNTQLSGNRTVDLDRLDQLAKYTAETWPEAEQGDSGRIIRGNIALGRGQYDEAIAAFESVRAASSRWIEAQNLSGGAHWQRSLVLREKGETSAAEEEVQKSLAKLNLALKLRREANAPDNDLGLVANVCDIAEVDLETNKLAEALTLLEPIAKKLGTIPNRSGPVNAAYSRVLTYVLKSHVGTGKVDLAIADMKALESIGGAGNSSARLYYMLGKLLEGEMDSLKKRDDKAGLARTEQSYQKFLKALVASKSGQSFQSLLWAADQLQKIGSSKEANEVYATLINTYGKDPQFLKGPRAFEQVTLVKLRQVATLRAINNLSEAETLLNEVIDQNKKSMEAQMEKGFLLDAKAEAKQGNWPDAYNHWKNLAGRLEKMSPKPTQYFEARYHEALALVGQGKKDLARTTLASVQRLSPAVGSPELKAKYDLLLKKIAK